MIVGSWPPKVSVWVARPGFVERHPVVLIPAEDDVIARARVVEAAAVRNVERHRAGRDRLRASGESARRRVALILIGAVPTRRRCSVWILVGQVAPQRGRLP